MMFAVVKDSGNRNIATYGGQVAIFVTAKQAVDWLNEAHPRFREGHSVLPCRPNFNVVFE